MDSILSIAETQQEIREAFEKQPSTEEKYKYLLKYARTHKGMDPKYKDEKFLVKGCATRVFLVPRFEAGRVWYETDTDEGDQAPLIVRGLAAIAQKIYSGHTPSEILAADPAFFQDIGLNVILTPTRSNGFASLLKDLYLYASAYKQLEMRKENASTRPES